MNHFQRKEAYHYQENAKIIRLGMSFIHPRPFFPLILNEITLKGTLQWEQTFEHDEGCKVKRVNAI